MKLILPALLPLLAVAVMLAADKPKVYNRVTAETTEIDPLVKKALHGKFTIVDIGKGQEYAPPRWLEGTIVRKARHPDGGWLGGKLLAGYVLTAEGRVAEPVVLKTSDERLNSLALESMKSWRMEAAKLDGKAVATTAAQEFEFETEPAEWVEQILEPTGGRISRPKEWFYQEGHRAKTYMWTLSREDTEGGKKHYRTGVRIQTFVGIKEVTGKTPKEFIADFVANKKKNAERIVKTCEEKNQGLFTRLCLEVEEGPYHLLYSMFWGNGDLDMAVLTISGTTKDLWEVYMPVFDKMSDFELIDMKRFEKK